MNKILIIAAHPDDEILGCGGTIARFVREGFEAYTLILGEGKTSRDKTRNREKRKEELYVINKETHAANNIIGIKDIFSYNFPDNRFDTVALLDIVKVIEEVKNKIKPDIIFTHFENDLNIDHRITYNAVITATRPLSTETTKEIYSFEVLSSTEWKFPLNFSPDTFFDITDTLDVKLKSMKKYVSELKKSPHPRSLEGIKLTARNWGMKTGLNYAEAFKTIRKIK